MLPVGYALRLYTCSPGPNDAWAHTYLGEMLRNQSSADTKFVSLSFQLCQNLRVLRDTIPCFDPRLVLFAVGTCLQNLQLIEKQAVAAISLEPSCKRYGHRGGKMEGVTA